MVSRKLQKTVKDKYDKTRKRLAKAAWKAFSIHVRSINATFGGYSKCYTCLRSYPWKELDAGHFFHTSKKKGEVRRWAIDYDERNVHPQCTRCNRYFHGSGQIYSARLIEQYGDGIIQELNKVYREAKELTNEELKNIITKYGSK